MLSICVLLGNVQPLGQIEKRGTSGGECYGWANASTGTGGGTGFVNSCIHSGSNDYSGGDTVWYNYAAATAETIKNLNSTESYSNWNITTESICPKGWTLPSTMQINALGGENPGSSAYVDGFSPVLGGGYGNGVLVNESTYGYWWGSTAYSGAARYRLDYNSSSLYTDGGLRRSGAYIRCVSEEKDVSDLTYMQDMTAKVADSPKGWTLPSKDTV